MLLIVQILGGLFGFSVAYAMYRLVELPYERSTAASRVKYLAEMEELKKQRNASRKRANLGTIK
jgi:hypothetical protein